jgi:hypothetical protein
MLCTVRMTAGFKRVLGPYYLPYHPITGQTPSVDIMTSPANGVNQSAPDGATVVVQQGECIESVAKARSQLGRSVESAHSIVRCGRFNAVEAGRNQPAVGHILTDSRWTDRTCDAADQNEGFAGIGIS